MVSEEELDKLNFGIKSYEEETSSEGSPKAAETGSESPERTLEVSDATGTLHLRPFKALSCTM